MAYPNCRPAERHFIEVTRVAKDRSWADIRVRTWAVSWAKRQPLLGGTFGFPFEPHTLTQADLVEQEADHMAKLAERGVRSGD